VDTERRLKVLDSNRKSKELFGSVFEKENQLLFELVSNPKERLEGLSREIVV